MDVRSTFRIHYRLVRKFVLRQLRNLSFSKCEKVVSTVTVAIILDRIFGFDSCVSQAPNKFRIWELTFDIWPLLIFIVTFDFVKVTFDSVSAGSIKGHKN